MSLFDEVIDRSTRASALESALVAHAVLDARSLDGLTLWLSPATCAVLEIIADSPTAARADLIGQAHLAASISDDRTLATQIIAIAEHVSTITVAELAAVGDIEHVIDLLDSVQRDARLFDRGFARAA
jgi:hypothetical protein